MICEKFLKTFINTKNYPLFKLKSLTDCEAAKILENTYRTINIAFIDEWTKYAELMKINLLTIISAIKARHTHSNIMKPGLGVGGYCLTKDPLFAEYSAKLFTKKKLSFPITKSSIEINKKMPQHSYNFINKFYKIKKSSKILIYGLAYKEDVSDIRHSPSITLFNNLKIKTKNIYCIDPLIKKNNWKKFNVVNKIDLKKIDLVIMCVKHQQFQKIPIKMIKRKSIVIDLNNVLTFHQAEALSKNGVKTHVLGVNNE
jgi:nucleotide sugar dehydrogenase